MRRIVVCLVVVGLSLQLAACTSVVPVPVLLPVLENMRGSSAQPGADSSVPTAATPEEAVEHYMQGIIEGNLQMALDAAATRDIARKFTFIRYVQRIHALPINQAMLPADDEMSVALNEKRSEQQLTSQIMNLAWMLLAGKVVDTASGMTAPVDDQWAVGVESLMDLSRLGDISIGEITLPDEELMASERYQENAQTIADVYGADEYTERVAQFSFEDEEYVVGFQLLRYGDNWEVMSQTSPLAGLPVTGVPVPVP